MKTARSHKSRAFDLVHEDEDVVVVDKAPGVLTVPTPKRERFTLVDEVSRHLSRSTRITKEAFVVHRLDRETSGLVVFGKSARARDRLGERWNDHERSYAAVVAGVVVDDEGTMSSRLVTDARSLTRRSSGSDEGEEAITRFSVLARIDGATLLSVVLQTGKRNQIRVHLKERGHPILGDDRYGGLGRHRRWDDRRLGLHAQVLGFPHPRTGLPLRFDTGLPAVFRAFIEPARRR
ncbi:MAG: RNA pseudouridine synthase [Deltaproteobacteria bacterium]|nr:RNA pseudouridine synthase [Deltaproteobacteria bacterium]